MTLKLPLCSLSLKRADENKEDVTYPLLLIPSPNSMQEVNQSDRDKCD
jgi:hypothetical protein